MKTTGGHSQPRTVEVRACFAFSQSTSHDGKRCSTSSSATRPSNRAERGAEAEVQAVAERQMVVDLPGDVEPVPLGEIPFVTVARAVEE